MLNQIIQTILFYEALMLKKSYMPGTNLEAVPQTREKSEDLWITFWFSDPTQVGQPGITIPQSLAAEIVQL